MLKSVLLKNGIGPCYADKINRIGIRICDLYDLETFKEKLAYNVEFKNKILTKVYEAEGVNYDEILANYIKYAEALKPYVTDTNIAVLKAVQEDKKVLFEGAQATMLDLDHGTYPFVTSSHPIAGGASTGAGVGPNYLKNIFGVVKAYAHVLVQVRSLQSFLTKLAIISVNLVMSSVL